MILNRYSEGNMSVSVKVKNHIIDEIGSLEDEQITELEKYIAFLKFRAHTKSPVIPDRKQMAAMYRSFAEEDKSLAEEGVEDYAQYLSQEDK